MKKNVILTLMLVLAFNVSFASFPISQNSAVKTTENQVNNNNSEMNSLESENLNLNKSENFDEQLVETPAAYYNYNKWTAFFLWLFLGFFAAHRWYAGKPVGYNLLYIFTLGGVGIWAIVDLVNILSDNF